MKEEKYWEGYAGNLLGTVCNKLGKRKEAIDYYNLASKAYGESGEKLYEANAINNASDIYIEMGDWQKALEAYQRVLSLVREVKDPKKEALALHIIGKIYSSLGDYQKAIDSYNLALPLYRENKKQAGEADTLYETCKAHLDLEEDRKAHDYCISALSIYRKIDNKDKEAATLHTLGLIHSRLGETRQSIGFYEQALPLWKSLGKEDSEAATLHSLSAAYNSLSDKWKALKYLDQALTIRRAGKDKKGEASSLNGIGAIYSDLGEYQKALEYLKLALSLAREVGDKIEEASIRNNFADLYMKLGETQEALKHFKQAQLDYKAANSKRGQALVLSNLGGFYSHIGRNKEALKSLNQALLLRREIDDKEGEAITLHNMGSIYAESGENQKALDYLKKALHLIRSVCNRSGQAVVLNNMAYNYFKLGNNQEAFENFAVALPLAKLSGDKASEANTLYNLMDLFEFTGHRRLAIFYGKLSVNMLQQMRRLNVDQGIENGFQKSFVIKAQPAYKKLAELLIKENLLEEAVEVINLYQDQQSFDLKPDSNNLIRPIGLSARENRLARQYETTSQKIGRLELQIVDIKRCSRTNLTEQEATKLAKLEAEISSAKDEYLAFYNGSVRALAKPLDRDDEVPPVKEVKLFQETLRTISLETKQNTVALYTLIGENGFHLLLVSPDGIKSFTSPIEFDEFDSKALQFYALLQSSDYDPRALGKELYRIILKPAEAELKRCKAQTLLWSLDGKLRYIPMAALSPDGKSYLAEQYQNVNFTRAETERITRKVSAVWAGTGFGSSKAQVVDLGDGKGPIPFGALTSMTKEMKGIFKANPTDTNGSLTGEVFTDKQFTKKKFYEVLKQGRTLIHISSHFLFRAGDYVSSFLLLGDETVLTLNEMKQPERGHLLKGVELLTLSACETAVIRPDSFGKEIDGFAELAQRLGADAVMATLWKVNEDSTAQLMKDFYKNYRSEKLDKGQALRKSQLNLLYGKYGTMPTAIANQNKMPCRGGAATDILVERKYQVPFKPDKNNCFSHPYYWSPFVLFGNWK